jgi:hypothetical protein
VANAGLNRFPEQRVPQDVRALATLLMGLKCPSSQCVARFPLRHGAHIVNLYGRSIGTAFAHHFLPGPKGGLYAWEQVQQCSDVILVEGLFDYEVLWQVGFHNLTCSLGTHLEADQFRQLCNRPRTVYLTFDVDANQSGQHAALQGSEWFLMWQSKVWNGQEEAFRMFAIVGVSF